MSAADRPPRPRPRPWGRRARRWLWRSRWLVVAVCCGVATTSAVDALAPAPPPTRDVVVTARPVAAGAEIGRSDVEVRAFPVALAPAGAVADPADVVGHVPAVPLAAGLPLSADLVAGGALTSLAPAGTVVVPVRLDDATTALLRPGDRVDVVSTTPGADGAAAPGYLARRALVLPSESRAPGGGGKAGGLLGGASGGDGAEVTLLAVSTEEAPGLSAGSSAGSVGAVVVP